MQPTGLILPEGAGQLAMPAAAAQHRAQQQRTLVPAFFQRAYWEGPFYVEPKDCTKTKRSHHRVLHVKVKTDELTLCRCPAPDGYPVLRGLTQEENAEVMTCDKVVAQWHRLTWCGFCTQFARTLIQRAS